MATPAFPHTPGWIPATHITGTWYWEPPVVCGGFGTADPVAPKQAAVNLAPRVGRNAPCPCGSGKKFKRCKEQIMRPLMPSELVACSLLLVCLLVILPAAKWCAEARDWPSLSLILDYVACPVVVVSYLVLALSLCHAGATLLHHLPQ